MSRLDIGRYFELLKLPQPYSMPPILERLEGDRIILRDGATYSITNLGQLLFARNLARFEDIGRKAARVISYEGTGKISTLRDHIITRGYAASFEHIIELVELQTPVREVIERALRREERAYPSVAVRELIANALIHILRGPRPFSEMNRGDRIRACYQHCCLRYVQESR